MRNRLAVLFVAVAFIAAACAGSGEPDDYDARVRENFVEGCTASGEQTADSAAISVVCECSYDGIVAAGIPYAEFKALDDALRDDINADFPSDISDIIADCIRSS